MSSIPVLTIDGPSGSGKGSITQMVAKHLGWHILDSGALYRLTALAAERGGVALDDAPALALIARGLDIEFLASSEGEPVKVVLGGEDVSQALRLETTGNNASKVALLTEVREALLQRQKDFRQGPGLVADGRDMGTVVFPGSDLKFFLNASVEVRSMRRFNEFKDQNRQSIGEVEADIRHRDKNDSTRAVAPLRVAEDAIVVEATDLNVDQVVKTMLKHARQKMSGVFE